MNNFKENLKELRKEKRLTQKELANEINVTDDCIYTWEKGKAEPSINQIIQLAIFFDCTTDYLLGIEEYEKTKKAVIYNHSTHNGNNNF